MKNITALRRIKTVGLRNLLVMGILAFFIFSPLVSGETAGTADITGNVMYIPLNARFTANITAGAAPLAVKFTDRSTGPPASWKWEFGNGGDSSDRNPTHTFSTAGSYRVVLNVTNVTGYFSQSAGTITVTGPFPTPVPVVTIPVPGIPFFENGGDDGGSGIAVIQKSDRPADFWGSCESATWTPPAVTIVNGNGLLTNTTNTSFAPDLFGTPGARVSMTTTAPSTGLPLVVIAGVIAVLAIIGSILLFFIRRDEEKKG